MKKFITSLCILSLVLITACSSSRSSNAWNDPNGFSPEQTSCRDTLAQNRGTAENTDIVVDIIGLNLYRVLVEDNALGWKVVPGNLQEALLIAHKTARDAGMPVRIVYGSTLYDTMLKSGVNVHTQDVVVAKQTFYATFAKGCTEPKAGTYISDNSDCIPNGSIECRVALTDACSEKSETFIDVSFAYWEGRDATGALLACYGAKARGPFSIDLAAQQLCKCGIDRDLIRGRYEDARQMLDATLQIRGFDQPTSFAVSTGMTVAALSKLNSL